jgi:hypothetical protein
MSPAPGPARACFYQIWPATPEWYHPAGTQKRQATTERVFVIRFSGGVAEWVDVRRGARTVTWLRVRCLAWGSVLEQGNG